jgi:hypothetical protein
MHASPFTSPSDTLHSALCMCPALNTHLIQENEIKSQIKFLILNFLLKNYVICSKFSGVEHRKRSSTRALSPVALSVLPPLITQRPLSQPAGGSESEEEGSDNEKPLKNAQVDTGHWTHKPFILWFGLFDTSTLIGTVHLHCLSRSFSFSFNDSGRF